VFIHPYAGVLSAYGIGLADVRELHEEAIEMHLLTDTVSALKVRFAKLEQRSLDDVLKQVIVASNIQLQRRVHVRYEGTDSAVEVASGNNEAIHSAFEALHRQRYGFIMPEKSIIVEAISVEAVAVQKRTSSKNMHPLFALSHYSPSIPPKCIIQAIFTMPRFTVVQIFSPVT